VVVVVAVVEVQADANIGSKKNTGTILSIMMTVNGLSCRVLKNA
jgi:hypothetical protein